MSLNEKSRKRPEIQIYRPGMGKLLGKKSDTKEQFFSDEPKSKDNDNIRAECKKSYENSNKSQSKGSNGKKPDIKVYIPPPKSESSELSKTVEQNSSVKVTKDKRENDNERERDCDNERDYSIDTTNAKSHFKHKEIGTKDKSRDKRSYDYRRNRENRVSNLKCDRNDVDNGVANVNNYVKCENKCDNNDVEIHKPLLRSDESKHKQNDDVTKMQMQLHSMKINSDHCVETRNSKSKYNKNFKSNDKAKPKKYPNKHETNHIPPRFLKLQMQKMSQKEQIFHDHHEKNAVTPYEGNSIMHTPNRGIIHLPPNSSSQVFGSNDSERRNLEYNYISNSENFFPHNTLSKHSSMSKKPCVAIRPTPHQTPHPTPHVSLQYHSDKNDGTIGNYSPSSSPDVNNTFAHYNYPHHVIRPQEMDRSYSPPNFVAYPVESAREYDNRLLQYDITTKKALKPVVEKNLREAIAAEKDLQTYMALHKDIDMGKIEPQRFRIQLRYEQIILSDLRLCAENNIEQSLWKSAFYQFIEHFRRFLEETTDKASVKTSLLKIVDEATLFFENLLVKLQEINNFSIEKFLESEYSQQTINYDVIKLASISAQKIYLYLGDLARYKEQTCKTTNFGKARTHYLKAQQLAPKNGRPYNQLALLAIYGKRKLEAVYYYMRSLAASNPIHPARENLLGIFDEVRKKYESAERKRKHEQLNLSKQNSYANESERKDTHTEERIEIWIRHDGTSAICSNYSNTKEDDNSEELDMLTSVELNKRFVLSFLHVHGKLFSKIGMEVFVPTVNQMLLEFHCLLKRTPIPFTSERLLQLLSINMFAVFHTSLKDSRYGPNCRSFLQEQAIHVTFAMMSLILECATSTLTEHLKRNSQSNFISDDLAELLPTIKIWTDWMSCQKHLWSPPPSFTDFRIRCKGDIWTMLAKFLTCVSNVNVRSVKLLPTRLEGCEAIVLPEDIMLAGFLPLLGAPHCTQFAQPPYEKEKAKACLRITGIQFFGDYLCGITEPYLEFDVQQKRFVSLIPAPAVNTEIKHCESSYLIETSDNEIEENSLNTPVVETDDTLESSRDQSEIQKLWSRQEELSHVKRLQEKMEQRVKDVLSEENLQSPARIVIQPRFIVPDTNCFIDHLGKFKCLIESGLYEIIIPLIVINELDGLISRGTMVNTKPPVFSDDHHGHVGKAAKAAVEFLSASFRNKHHRLKAITSKGSLLDSMSFTSESLNDTRGISNDDLVLNCCLHFIKDGPLNRCAHESTHQRGKRINIFREAVLLTEDRNLRVKALSHNIPVKSLPVFMQWANISWNTNSN